MCDIGLGCCTLCGLHVYALPVRVTSHYFASVALSVRGWVGAWHGLVDGAGLRDLSGWD